MHILLPRSPFHFHSNFVRQVALSPLNLSPSPSFVPRIQDIYLMKVQKEEMLKITFHKSENFNSIFSAYPLTSTPPTSLCKPSSLAMKLEEGINKKHLSVVYDLNLMWRNVHGTSKSFDLFVNCVRNNRNLMHNFDFSL